MTSNATAVCFALSLSFASFAVADSVSLFPIKDNTLIQNSSGTLSNGTGDIFFGRTGPTAGNIICRGLIDFDIAGNIPAGATISGVTLTINQVKGSSDPTAELHRVLRDWGEGSSLATAGSGAPATTGDATWLYTFFNTASPAWTTPGGDYSTTLSATGLITSGLITWSSASNPQMRADVQTWLDQPAVDFGWLIAGNEIATFTANRLSSREAGSLSPVLTVQFSPPAPEPSTLVLAMVGVMGLVAARFRRCCRDRGVRRRGDSNRDGSHE